MILLLLMGCLGFLLLDFPWESRLWSEMGDDSAGW